VVLLTAEEGLEALRSRTTDLQNYLNHEVGGACDIGGAAGTVLSLGAHLSRHGRPREGTQPERSLLSDLVSLRPGRCPDDASV